MPTCIEAVLLHEAGHALGLRHVAGTGAVMSAEGSLVLVFAPADEEECGAAGVCAQPFR